MVEVFRRCINERQVAGSKAILNFLKLRDSTKFSSNPHEDKVKDE